MKTTLDLDRNHRTMSSPSASATQEEGEKPAAKCSFFRVRKKARGNVRGRVTKVDTSSDDSHDTSDDEGNVAVVVDRSKKKNKVGVSRTANKKELAASSSSSNEDEEVKASSVGVSFKGSGATERSGPQDMGATATFEIDADAAHDARAVEERARAGRVKDLESNPLDDKTYKGLNRYAKFLEKQDTGAGSAVKMSTGPQRAPSNVRSTVRWDYAPDICKDFKETGYCGFGDSCKFMHDRSDYKFGWQLEREMQDGTYGEDDEDAGKYEISSDEEDLPFKCFLCKDSFKSPVVTRCKHYFCEKCALEHYRKSQRCFACGKQTGGVFNPAKELIAKLKKEEDKEKKRAEKNSDDDSDSDD